jgi:hypothetical protein
LDTAGAVRPRGQRGEAGFRYARFQNSRERIPESWRARRSLFAYWVFSASLFLVFLAGLVSLHGAGEAFESGNDWVKVHVIRRSERFDEILMRRAPHLTPS